VTIDWETGRNTDAVMSIDDDKFIPGQTELAKAVRKHGAKIAMQLYHSGNEARIPGEKVAPSAVSHRTGTPRELTKDKILWLVSRFADAAERAKRAGYDGVELHGAHRYVIAEFLSPETNKRRDEYGGDVVGRARFLVEILRAIREKVGPDFPVWTRMNAREDGIENGLTLEDGRQIARMAQEAGADAIDVSAWGNDAPGKKPGDILHLAKAIKQAVTVPVMAVGGRMTPGVAEQALREDMVDIAMIGRGLIADPEYVNKVAEGRAEDIRPCISCWECIPKEYFVGTGRWEQKESIRCTVNADMGHEREYEIKPAETPLRVVVIGGGLAGMEAARTATLRGHHVTLLEASSELSKLLPSAAEAAGRYIGKLKRYLARQIVKLGVDIRLGAQVSADLILPLKPDRIILATESTLMGELFESFKGSVPEIHRIGDSVDAKDVQQMIHEAAQVGRL
jgi:2,4-dienoyl-CoA reductase-like NADH-dependent reductase (Old Yellow Enzyme family)